MAQEDKERGEVRKYKWCRVTNEPCMPYYMDSPCEIKPKK